MVSSSSIRFLDQYSNQVRASSSPSPPLSFSKRNDNITVTPRCSKAQVCLHKILRIITSHQQQQKREGSIVSRTNGLELMNDDAVLVHKDQSFVCSGGNRLLGIDLNLRLGCLFNESATIEKGESSSQGECEPKLVIEEEAKDRNFNGEDHKNNDDDDEEEEEKDKEEATDDHSEITNLQFQSSEKDQNENLENGQCQKHEKSETVGENLKNEGFLGLLVEAARWVSENYSDESGNKSRQEEEEEEEEEEEGRVRVRGGGGGGRGIEKDGGKRSGKKCNKNKILGSKRKEGCDNNVDVNVYVVEYEDNCKSPVVRSKRGRSQVLPVRYRDSVLEPWKKGFSRPPRVVAGSNKKRKSR